jgi:signal transduction histidine kinase
MDRRTGRNTVRRAGGHVTLGSVATQFDSESAADRGEGGRLAALRLRLDPHRLSLAALRPSSWRDLALCLFVSAIWLVEIVSTADKTVTPDRLAGVIIGSVPFVAIAWRPQLGQKLLVISGICWLSATALRVSAPDDVVLMIGIYTVATQASWRRILESCLFTLGVAVVVALVGAAWKDVGSALTFAAAWMGSLVVLVALGRWIARRRQLIQTLVDRNLNLERARQQLEAERDEMARQAVAVERARLARELHDVVAHHVSVMVIQAGAAQASLPPEAKAASQSLEAIRETGREALAEMRRMLGLLRSQEAAAGGTGTEGGLAPQPGLADLAALCDRTREAGVSVTTEIEGEARRLPAGVDLSIYRVVQEALTNALRHGGPGTRARLHLVYAPAMLTVEVTDDGRGKPAVGSVERSRQAVGHGLVGMRERVILFGGRLEAGPLPGGGFRVLALFPLEPAEAGSAGAAGTAGTAGTAGAAGSAGAAGAASSAPVNPQGGAA